MAKVCKIILIDEVNCACLGMSQAHNMFFFEKYGIHTENYFFSPKYQLGSWDGKIRYFHKTGKTYITLLDEIVPDIVEFGYEIELEDKRNSLPVTPKLIDENFFSTVLGPDGKPWKVRDYQVEMVNSLLSASNGVGICGTGGGKTSMTAALAKSYELAGDLRSIIIVPDTTLTDQTKESYKFFGLDVGEYTGSSKDLNHQHVVSTWQTLKNNPQVITEFKMVIVDECVDATTNILLADGTSKEIIDININDTIISYNVDTNKFEKDRIIKKHENLSKSSMENMYELTFDNGQTIKLTGNHEILTTIGLIRADLLDENHEIINISDRMS